MPLPHERELRDAVDPAHLARRRRPTRSARPSRPRFADDTVRGVVATDALIGTFASLHDPSLIQNRCFLYHLIGNGTGEWRVPVGGMGAVTDALARSATVGRRRDRHRGRRQLDPDEPGDGAEVGWHDGMTTRSVTARRVLSGVAPWVLRILLGEDEDPGTKPAGAQLKINMLLDRLPRLRSGADPAVAFAGTLHLGEDYTQLERAYAEAAAGSVPTTMPGEVYCHSLTDPSILGDLAGTGTQTLTYFGLHTPAALFETDPRGRQAARRRARHRLPRRAPRRADRVVPASRDARRRPVHRGQDPAGRRARPGHARRPHLPRRPRLAVGAQPRPAATPRRSSGASQTDDDVVLLCGSGARRGGAVSGLGGHNAAQAVLADLG